VNDPYWYAMWLGVVLGVRLWDWARRAATRRREPAAGPDAVTASGYRSARLTREG